MDIVTKFLDTVLRVLPTSPFSAYIDALGNISFLGYVNYFVPVSVFIAIGEAWLVAVGVFYLWSIILRWIRAIE